MRVAFSGDEAIKIASEFRPQLVVLDINMPGLNGFETAERLKQQSWAHAAAFVAHTAASQTLRPAATAAGFHHFVVKAMLLQSSMPSSSTFPSTILADSARRGVRNDRFRAERGLISHSRSSTQSSGHCYLGPLVRRRGPVRRG